MKSRALFIFSTLTTFSRPISCVPKEMEMEMMVAALMFNSCFLYYEVSSATLTSKFSNPWPEHENSLAPLVLFLP